MKEIVLYHYYDSTVGPFMSLSDLPRPDAKAVLDKIKTEKPGTQGAQRHDKYVEYRHNCEALLRERFKGIGGVVKRESPHYMVVGHSPWLSSWFENSAFVKIPAREFDLRTVSFTYSDSMPTFSPTLRSEKEYFHTLYDYSGILKIIEKYGLPQLWNDDGKHGYERYVEAHVWSDETINQYRQIAGNNRNLGRNAV